MRPSDAGAVDTIAHPVVDTHAHVMPPSYMKAIEDGAADWHGLNPGNMGRWGSGWATPLPQRVEYMEEVGVDIQLVTPNVGFYQYTKDPAVTSEIARDCNNDIAEIVRWRSDRFMGLGTLPMQDVGLAIAELQRCVGELGMTGAIISDHVAGTTYDDPDYLDFFKAAEELGAVLFFHQGGDTCVESRTKKYALGNAVGNLTERTLAFAALVFSGVMDKCPELKALLGHGGGYTTFGIARLDKVSGALEPKDRASLTSPFSGKAEGDFALQRAPREYLRNFYYDTCVYDDFTLKFIVDVVGADRVMLGTDYPAPMFQDSPVEWVKQNAHLSDGEKAAVLSETASAFLSLAAKSSAGHQSHR